MAFVKTIFHTHSFIGACIILLLYSGTEHSTNPVSFSQHNLMQKSAQTVDALNGSAQGIPLCMITFMSRGKGRSGASGRVRSECV